MDKDFATCFQLPAIQEMRVQSLGQEDPVEKEMATHFSILAWRIPQTEEPGGLGPQSCRESDTSDRVNTYIQHIYSQLYSRHHPHHRAQG